MESKLRLGIREGLAARMKERAALGFGRSGMLMDDDVVEFRHS
jgi:hypothetical protein